MWSVVKYLEIAEALDGEKLFCGLDSFDMVNFLLDSFRGDGFHQIAGHMELKCGYCVFFVSRTENDLTAGLKRNQFFRKSQTADTPHIDVQKGNINGIFRCVCQCGGTGGEAFHLCDVRRGTYRFFQSFQHIQFIINSNCFHAFTPSGS